MGFSKEVFMPEAGAVFSSRNLGQEGTEKPKKHPVKNRTSGFEPFVSPEPSSEGLLFVNIYNGNFAQAMTLNRRAIERVLKIAHLDGQVFLTSLAPNRQRSLDANPDGSATRKRFLIFGEKIEEDEKDNPPSKVTAVPKGWKIEINDQRLTEELMDQELNGAKLQTEFVRKFNTQLKEGLWECILREKLTGEKTKYFKTKIFYSLLPITLSFATQASNLSNDPLATAPWIVGGVFTYYGLINTATKILRTDNHDFNPGQFLPNRQIRGNPWEYLMPEVQIDKAARSLAFLSFKDRKLVEEAKPESR